MSEKAFKDLKFASIWLLVWLMAIVRTLGNYRIDRRRKLGNDG
ncbi:hypothetical protein BANRA_00013 [Acinetobacter baumannii]|nr:hypothetical protein BANRA_00013 [Acinetobacter baumannii]